MTLPLTSSELKHELPWLSVVFLLCVVGHRIKRRALFGGIHDIDCSKENVSAAGPKTHEIRTEVDSAVL